MLSQLTIQNFITLEHQTLEFQSGFNVITGETGAGKSLVLKSLLFLFGEKLSSTSLKNPQEPLSISGVFEPPADVYSFLKSRDISVLEEGPLVVRRLFTPDQKTRAYLNEVPVTVGFLKELRPLLFSLQNQFDLLLSPQAQTDLLDRAGNLYGLKTTLEEAHSIWKKTEKDLQNLKDHLQQLAQEKEFIEAAFQELETLAPEENEEEKILHTRHLAKTQGETSHTLQECLSILGTEDTLLSQTYKVSKKLHKVEDATFTEQIQQKLDLLSETNASLHDQLTSKLHESLSAQEYDIDALETRLHQLRGAARKYHCSVEDLPKKLQEFQTQSSSLSHSNEALKKYEVQNIEALNNFIEASETLFKKREETAEILLTNVQKELPALMLEKMRLKITLTPLPESSWSSKGTYAIDILVRSNVDLPFTPLHQTASGGERSRLMLAFEKATSHLKKCPTLFFDEIDKGVGGAVANAVGTCLKVIGENHQVIAISHAPQVAALAPTHFLVDKSHEDHKSVSVISLLTDKTRLQEIARMLSGAKITPETLSAAQSLLTDASLNKPEEAKE